MEILRFALLGLGTGAVYAILGQGLVLIYRGSGLINFAQGAVAMVGAYLYYETVTRFSMPTGMGLLAAVAGCAALGLGLRQFILKPMRRSSPLTRVIATLGILLTLQSAAYLRYGHDPRAVPSLLPENAVVFGDSGLRIGQDSLWLIAIGVLLTVALTTVFRRTSIGRLTSAVSENQLATAAFGHSPDRIAAFNWAAGSGLAGLAGVLIAPIIFLEPTQLVLLVLPALAAALLGQFSSFPLTLTVALLLGVAQSEIQRFAPIGGLSTAVPFAAVLVILIVRGRALPLRNFITDRLPRVGDGELRPAVIVALTVMMSALLFSLGDNWVAPITVTLAYAIIALSVVLITGYTGQLSLAQTVLAGLGAVLAAKFVQTMPFAVALILSAVVVSAVGGLVSLPALRLRGVTLAVVTLGMAGALADLLLYNPSFTGGIGGVVIPSPSLGWVDLSPFRHPSRYAVMVLLVLVGCSGGLANLRRSATGRRLLAVRSNERAAAAAGVHGSALKAYAFMLGAAIAAVGGVLLTFMNTAVAIGDTGQFDVIASILLVAVVVVGGIGYVGGGLMGALLITGGVVSHAVDGIPSVSGYLPLAGGVILILNLMFAPDGLFELNREALGHLMKRKRQHDESARGQSRSEEKLRPTAKRLVVEHLSVSFGGVKAVRDVSLSVEPGEIHGLIGPNGSGKTTFIDAVTGFVTPEPGARVALGATELGQAPARRRAVEGISRSFQSLELFDGLTVRENLAVPGERPGVLRAFTDLVRPGSVVLNPAAREAVEQFELHEVLDKLPTELSLGQRKSAAISRAIAAAPSVLLLDEPAAGLDEHETRELAEMIATIAREWGIGVLLVEHQMDMIMSTCDRITVLESGAVLASGTPAEVRRNAAVIDAYLGEEISHVDDPGNEVGDPQARAAELRSNLLIGD